MMTSKRKDKRSSGINSNEKITRKQAVKKAGLVAFSAATMMLLLSKPEKAMAQDSAFNPDDPDTW